MKLLILSLCVTYALADVSHIVGQKDESSAQIIKQEYDISPDGAYSWFQETENSITSGAKGENVAEGADGSSQVSQGYASWKSPEGETIEIQYVADKNGYQPVGSHIPTPPPIPAAIIRSLEYIRAHYVPQPDSE